ncbi:MAG: S41 family peptidase [Spirochaetota bacterium]
MQNSRRNKTIITGSAVSLAVNARYFRAWYQKAAFASLLFALIALLPGLKAEPKGAGSITRSGTLEADSARQDFRIMQSIFSQAHATAFAQIPKPPLPDLFAGRKNVSIRDFVTRVLGYYRGIQVDHTGLGFSPQLIESLGLKTALFPFPLKFFQGRAYFDCAYKEIPFGAELIKINGQSLAEIFKRFNTFTSVLNERGQGDDYRLGESFSFLYYMVEGPRSQWQLTLTDGAATREVLVDTGDGGGSAFVPRKSLEQPNYAQPVYIMFNPQLKAAYLALNSFMPSGKDLDSIESWNNMLYAFHREAAQRKVENLVIDLRVNRGGVMLFSAAAASWFVERRIDDKSRSRARSRVLPYREHVQAVNSMAVSEQILLDTEKHLQSAFSDKLVDGYFETRRSEARYLTLTPVEQAHRFRRIYILVSRATYSAAVNFARLVKLGNANTVLVGEETGSPGDGHSAEILITYKLPNSGLLFEIPLVQVQFSPLVPKQEKGRGLLPDVVSAETPADFLSSRDAQLEAVSTMMQKPVEP